MQSTKLIRKNNKEINQLSLPEIKEEFKYVNTIQGGKHQGKRKSRVYKDKLYARKVILMNTIKLIKGI